MKQRVPLTILLAISTVTFLLGSMLGILHRSILNSPGEIQKIEPVGPALDRRASLTPLRIGIFIGVDSVTFSADGKKFEHYEGYEDRETLVAMSPGELMDLANRLRSAGLFEEAEFNAPMFVSLPQNFTIVIAWPDEQRRFTWIHGAECSVPEKYLEIFERLNGNLKLPLIRDFVVYNRRRQE
jgi:hypothetical protein